MGGTAAPKRAARVSNRKLSLFVVVVVVVVVATPERKKKPSPRQAIS
jgi:hypothetical protein